MKRRKKAANIRRQSAKYGKMTMSPGGFVIMVYEEAIDNGNAPEVYVTGISKIEKIGPGTLRVTLYTQIDDQKIVAVREIWDAKIWDEAVAIAEDAKLAISYGPSRGGDGPGRSKGAH